MSGLVWKQTQNVLITMQPVNKVRVLCCKGLLLLAVCPKHSIRRTYTEYRLCMCQFSWVHTREPLIEWQAENRQLSMQSGENTTLVYTRFYGHFGSVPVR